MADINKVGLATFKEGRLLLVRKRSGPSLILPGGKPEAGEGHLDTLVREVREELSCGVDGVPSYLGTFSDWAADKPGVRVHVHLYEGNLLGTPVASMEIAELIWFHPMDIQNMREYVLAPSLINSILPFLFLGDVPPVLSTEQLVHTAI